MLAWEKFLTLQDAELGTDTVNKWLRPLKVLRFDACNLYLEAKDSFQALWFEEHVRQKVQTRLLNNNNKRIKVHLSIANVSASKLTKVKAQKKQPSTSNAAAFIFTIDELDPYCTFENFVISESNLLPHKLLCKMVGYDPDTNSLVPGKTELCSFNPVYLYGNGGTGKTHLMMAAAHALKCQGLNVIYARAETFTEHVVSAIRAGEMSKFRQAYRNIDALLIDDVHVFSRKGATQEELFHTFNTLHLAGRQIILSAHCAPSDLQFIEPRLVSRFEWGIVIPLEPLEKDKVAEVLQKKAASLHYNLHPKVAEFLLNTFTSSTKALNRALEALILRSHMSQASGKQSSITVSAAVAQHLLSDLILEEQQTALTAEKIFHTTAEHFGIRQEDILGKAQSRDCVLPRQLAMYLCRTHLKLPFMKIGDLFTKDHSTVMSSVRQINKAIESDDRDITSALNVITKKLKS